MPVDGGLAAQLTFGDEHAHFPWYLPDGRLAYIAEHVTSNEAWTDVWALDTTGRRAPELLFQKIRIQGPYELSPDGERLLFHSPRGGNFDIYLADLSVPGGYEALQTVQPLASTEVGAAPARAGATGVGRTSELGGLPVLVAAGSLLAAGGVLLVGLLAVSLIRSVRRRRHTGGSA